MGGAPSDNQYRAGIPGYFTVSVFPGCTVLYPGTHPKGSGTSPQSDYVLKRTKLKHTVCFTIQNRGGRRLSGQPRPSTQVTAPRGTFPRSRTTSPGRTTTGYTQTTPLRAEGVPSAAWSRRLTRDRRPRRSKQGLLCRLAIARAAAWCTPGCTLDHRPPAVPR